VIPLFKKQIKQGGPVTVTDPKVIRYFMTVSEAVQLVIQAGAMMKGGDVFVLDMGEPVNILQMARKMIHLSGLEIRDENRPDGDMEIVYTGLRPGEKLYEELLIGNNVSSTEHPKIMRAEESVVPWEVLEPLLIRLTEAAKQDDVAEMRTLLAEVVSGFNPISNVQKPLSIEPKLTGKGVSTGHAVVIDDLSG
jgi:FlaA1/EpsC-like NDP-sugar epimerase